MAGAAAQPGLSSSSTDSDDEHAEDFDEAAVTQMTMFS